MKIKSKLSIGVLAVTALALGGCASHNIKNIKNGYMTSVSNKTFPKSEAKNIVLVYKNEPDQNLPCKKYMTIGQVKVDTYDPYIGWDRSPETISTNFKAGGASLGADAVINIAEVDEVETGYAIKCGGA